METTLRWLTAHGGCLFRPALGFRVYLADRDGFPAVRRDEAGHLLPKVVDQEIVERLLGLGYVREEHEFGGICYRITEAGQVAIQQLAARPLVPRPGAR